MKLLVCLSLLVCTAHVSFGQYIIRVHAFSQEIMPGVAPAVGDGEIYKPKKHFDYQVFIECKRSVTINLKSIRVKEKLYAASLQVVESPVVQYHPTTMKNDTLVKRTSNKLLKVFLGKELTSRSRDSVGALITYSVRGKIYSQRVRSFKELAPIAMP